MVNAFLTAIAKQRLVQRNLSIEKDCSTTKSDDTIAQWFQISEDTRNLSTLSRLLAPTTTLRLGVEKRIERRLDLKESNV